MSPKHMPYITGLACLLVLFLLFACNEGDAGADDTSGLFKDAVLERLLRVHQVVEPMAAGDAWEEMSLVILADTQDNPEKLLPTYGIVALDRDGILRAGVRPDPETGFAVFKSKFSQDYSTYSKFKKLLAGQGPDHFVLYLPDSTWFVVGLSMSHQKKPNGALCLMLKAEKLKRKLGIGKDEFLALSFE